MKTHITKHSFILILGISVLSLTNANEQILNLTTNSKYEQNSYESNLYQQEKALKFRNKLRFTQSDHTIQNSSTNGSLSNQEEDNDDYYTVHMVCHSHNDIAYQMTSEEYYTQRVESILTTVVQALLAKTDRKFSYAEIYYFQKWWIAQNDSTKASVKSLVKEGRLEFVLGGWAQPDEACPTFEELILNIMNGHQFLKKELGYTTKVAWMVDSFGHSGATPEMLVKMGFESLFFSRLSDKEKDERKANKEMEFYWKPTYEGPNGPVNSKYQIWTHVTHELYQGACDIDLWTYYANRQYIENLFNNKIAQHKSKTAELIKCFEKYASHYKTKHILFTLGTDFAYLFANLSYSYIEQIVQLANQQVDGKKFKFVYSTVQEYVDAVQKEQQKTDFDWPVYKGDWYPLNFNYPGHYMSGYFTSRANFKKYIRDFTSYAQGSSTLYTLEAFKYNISGSNFLNYTELTSLLQQKSSSLTHHDTITGTSMSYVIQNITADIKQLQETNDDMMTKLLSDKALEDFGISIEHLIKCANKINDRYLCPGQLTNNQFHFVTVIYNPSVYEMEYSTLILPHANLTVSYWSRDHNRFVVTDAESICTKGPDETNECEVFIFHPIAPLNYEIIRLDFTAAKDTSVRGDGFGELAFTRTQTNNVDYTNQSTVNSNNPGSVVTNPVVQKYVSYADPPVEKANYSSLCNNSMQIKNDRIHLEIDQCSEKQITFLMRKDGGPDRKFEFDFRYYVPQHEGQLKKSGVYVFKTSDNDSQPFDHYISEIQTYKGKQMQMFIIHYLHNINPHSIVKIKLGKNYDQVEFDVFFARLEQTQYGQDVTINWKSLDINNNNIFYADVNAYRIVKRVMDETKPYTESTLNRIHQVASHFYPINAGLFIEDPLTGGQMIVMNDRPQGGSAYNQGRIELMINRFGVTNDELGMWEPMKDYSPDNKGINVTAKFYFSYTKDREEAYRMILKRHILNQNQLQYYLGTQFTLLDEDQSQSIKENTNDRLTEFEKFLKENEIYEIQLIPSYDFEQMYLRLVRFNNKKDIDTEDLLDQICSYTLKNKCKNIKGLKQTLLDGDDIKTLNATVIAQNIEYFAVDNYEILFEK